MSPGVLLSHGFYKLRDGRWALIYKTNSVISAVEVRDRDLEPLATYNYLRKRWQDDVDRVIRRNQILIQSLVALLGVFFLGIWLTPSQDALPKAQLSPVIAIWFGDQQAAVFYATMLAIVALYLLAFLPVVTRWRSRPKLPTDITDGIVVDLSDYVKWVPRRGMRPFFIVNGLIGTCSVALGGWGLYTYNQESWGVPRGESFLFIILGAISVFIFAAGLFQKFRKAKSTLMPILDADALCDPQFLKSAREQEAKKETLRRPMLTGAGGQFIAAMITMALYFMAAISLHTH